MIINSKIFDTTHQLFPISHPWTLGVLYIPKHHFKSKILGIIILIGGINKVLFTSYALFSFPSLFHLHWCHNHHYHQLWHVVIIERILSLLLPLDVIMNMFDVNQYLFWKSTVFCKLLPLVLISFLHSSNYYIILVSNYFSFKVFVYLKPFNFLYNLLSLLQFIEAMFFSFYYQ